MQKGAFALLGFDPMPLSLATNEPTTALLIRISTEESIGARYYFISAPATETENGLTKLKTSFRR